MKWIGCLGVLLCAVASLKAMPVMDSVPLLSRIGSAQQPIRHFAVMPYENPAMRLDRYDATLTRLSLSGYYAMQKEAIQLQLGDGAVFGQVDALAFVRKKQFSLWGGAGYENGRKRISAKGNDAESDPEILEEYGKGTVFAAERRHGGRIQIMELRTADHDGLASPEEDIAEIGLQTA